jgi:acetyl esterase/lipase
MRSIVTILFMLMTISTQSQIIPLYDDSIPNSVRSPDEEKAETGDDGVIRVSAVQKPTLEVFLPKNPNGTAVLVCPGGGYSIVALNLEGQDIARKMNEWGITAFVLKYRLPSPKWMVKPEIGPLQDVQRSLIIIRENAAKWKIKAGKLGIMGFSAGGHLAATGATKFRNCVVRNPENISVRPDFQMLIYPVISFNDSIAHMGSRENLIGKNPSSEKIHEFSAEENVDRETPPCLLIHCAEDDVVSHKNSLAYYNALLKNNVPADLHIYSRGGHGFGTRKMNLPADTWLDLVHSWLNHLQ